jgi:predicted Zn-ribbon and HTH transcriptional regulator
MRKEYMHSYNSILLLVHQYLGKNWSLLNYSNKVLTVQHECGFIQKFDNYRLLYNRKITNKYESCPACIKRHIVIKQLNSYKEIAEKNNLKILINSKSLNKDINGIIIFNRKLQLPVKCNICGYEYFSTGNNIQQGKSCPKCAKKKRSTILSLVYPKKNIDAFKIMVRELTGDEYSVLSEEYIDNKTKLQLIHNSCNTIYDVRPNDFQQGYRCPICSLENQKSKNHKLHR